jgi:hypothetical protein
VGTFERKLFTKGVSRENAQVRRKASKIFLKKQSCGVIIPEDFQLSALRPGPTPPWKAALVRLEAGVI